MQNADLKWLFVKNLMFDREKKSSVFGVRHNENRSKIMKLNKDGDGALCGGCG